MSSNALKEIERVKLKDREYMSLEGWSSRKHFQNQTIAGLWEFDKLVNYMYTIYDRKLDTIDRVSASTLTSQEFVDKYERMNIPVIITDSTKDWNVFTFMYTIQINRYWTFEEMYRRYGDVNFKIAEDDKGSKLRVPLKYFLEYMVYNQDDSPLYLFERYKI